MPTDCVPELEKVLSEPSDADVECVARLNGDVLIVGTSGKMGPSLARRIQRAAARSGSRCRVLGASRFSSAAVRAELEAEGITTLQCDLLDAEQVEVRRQDVRAFLRSARAARREYDLVLVDPPYRLAAELGRAVPTILSEVVALEPVVGADPDLAGTVLKVLASAARKRKSPRVNLKEKTSFGELGRRLEMSV